MTIISGISNAWVIAIDSNDVIYLTNCGGTKTIDM